MRRHCKPYVFLGFDLLGQLFLLRGTYMTYYNQVVVIQEELDDRE